MRLDNSKAANMFKATYGDKKNLMADYILGYERIKGHSVEISVGSKIFGSGVFYGITVLKDVGESLHEHNKIFNSLNEAIQYCRENLGKS